MTHGTRTKGATERLRRLAAALVACTLASPYSAAAMGDAGGPCRTLEHLSDRYTVCTFDPSRHRIALHLRDGDGEPYGSIAALAASGVTFDFAMNGGMYRDDLSPVGLYVENGERETSLSTRDGWGNFHLLPNGVFHVSEGADGSQRFGVTETLAFDRSPPADLLHATQSGPMLVIDGQLHPRFLPRSDSLKIRNGVGVTADGTTHFAISHGRVRFHDFGTLFRDVLETPNALFLDGTISAFRAGHRRQGGWRAIGPIITASPIEPSSDG